MQKFLRYYVGYVLILVHIPHTGSLSPLQSQDGGVVTTQASVHYKLQPGLQPIPRASLYLTPGTGLHPTPGSGLHPTSGTVLSTVHQGLPGLHNIPEFTMGKQLSYNQLAHFPHGGGVGVGHMTRHG